MRVGFPVTQEEVLAGPVTRDRWDVLGSRDEEQDRLLARRVWLRGRRTGRAALVLSFAPAGQALDASLVTGTTIDADLVFYPGAAPLRALVAARHGTPEPTAVRGGGSVVAEGKVPPGVTPGRRWTRSPLSWRGIRGPTPGRSCWRMSYPGESRSVAFPLHPSHRRLPGGCSPSPAAGP